MNKKVIFHTIGYILLIEAALLFLPLVVGLIYHEYEIVPACVASIAITAAAGGILVAIRPGEQMVFARDGLVIVALSWVFMSVFGCLPFFLSGAIPNFMDALFETVSGFTTTGSSILTDIEAIPKGLLFWRSFTHWVGGMGVLVLVLLVMPMAGGQNMHLLRAESPGPMSGKLVPKMRQTARILYGIYVLMTVVLIILLLFGGMNLYDALVHAFGTAGTGGFSSYSDSIGAFDSAYIDIVISIFMIAFGVNFNLYYLLLIRQARDFFKSEELRWYLGILAFSIVTITISLKDLFDGPARALRASLFQVAAVMSSTGYSTADFDVWPQYARTLLVLLMFVGACAGSTGGGMKVSRILLLAKTAQNGIRRTLHPRATTTIRLDKKPVDRTVLNNCAVYLIIYAMIAVISLLLLSLNGYDFETNVTAVITCFNNIGPGLNVVGPTGNFSGFHIMSKIVLMFDMLAGRLEIFPFMALFAPALWRRRSKK